MRNNAALECPILLFPIAGANDKCGANKRDSFPGVFSLLQFLLLGVSVRVVSPGPEMHERVNPKPHAVFG
jgi:hypothetical protein